MWLTFADDAEDALAPLADRRSPDTAAKNRDVAIADCQKCRSEADAASEGCGAAGSVITVYQNNGAYRR
jgi:hypothetical protein